MEDKLHVESEATMELRFNGGMLEQKWKVTKTFTGPGGSHYGMDRTSITIVYEWRKVPNCDDGQA